MILGDGMRRGKKENLRLTAKQVRRFNSFMRHDFFFGVRELSVS
jgi:hypothetical protein